MTARRGGARRKTVLVALPASVLATAFALGLVELWVRSTWDVKRGTPGLFLSDPVLGQRLAPGYDGWFAGVPVHINALGFRDPRDYAVEKPPGTFRILVLGDSVTFGHGAIYEATYPYLLEQKLKAWRPKTTWEVWNLGVPGYNTGQELALLQDAGPRYAPDLVVVGFYENDFTNNEITTSPSFVARSRSAIQRFLQRRLYSYDLYKRASLTAMWKLRADAFDRERLDHLATEQALLNQLDRLAESDQQQLIEPEFFDAAAVDGFECIGVGGTNNASALTQWQRTPGWDAWLAALRRLQQLHRDGAYRIVFFVNMAPPACPGYDRFYKGEGALEFSADLTRILGEGTLAVSPVRAFLHYRPSQMPRAGGHSIGNANRVKADVLFDFLERRVLPELLHVRHLR